ncbi:HAD-like protein [Tothia fuscella]|uniref:HAD-like protein n=1 Tax=Tothia fuscella TaxID=1048955 RepID=A0A9P4NNU3_9PEZI|nr:HAD-like protein [Tothia fuscella]
MMPHMEDSEPSFSAPPEIYICKGLLFDMDGTIIDSTAAIVKHWTAIATELGVDPEVILATSHGRRSIDVLHEYDPKQANMEYVQHIEGSIPKTYGSDATEIPGSRALLDSLVKVGAPWAIVTSGTGPLLRGWLDVMKLAKPAQLVVAEDVKLGKPDPEGYRLGYSRLGLPADAEALVFEDAPAGVRAGKAAGFKVVALATTHKIPQLKAAGADWVVQDMRSVTLDGFDKKTGEIRVEISGALVD